MFGWGCGVWITGACWSTGGVNALCALRGSGRSAINPWRDRFLISHRALTGALTFWLLRSRSGAAPTHTQKRF